MRKYKRYKHDKYKIYNNNILHNTFINNDNLIANH